MGDAQTLDEIEERLDERDALAVTQGILDGGHYDAEPSPEDAARRPKGRAGRRADPARRPAQRNRGLGAGEGR
jgi:hypothetical protein